MVNVRWAKRVLLVDIRANIYIPAKLLNDLLWKRFNVEMAQSTMYRVRAKALKEIHGGHDASYKLLPVYCDVIRALNPNSLAFCAWNPTSHPEGPLAFSSIFISFKAVLDWLVAGCRSIIGVNGTHLKGNYGGVLLSSVALDANNELFPITWAIVEDENTKTWKFFIWYLKNALKDSGRGDEWCIISDRQKGIQATLTDLWPKVGKRYCYKHLVKNFKFQFPGLLMLSLFWKAAGAYNSFTFKKAMKALKKANPAALVSLSDVRPQSTWSKHAFNPAIKCDMNKSNFVESFNATLGINRCRTFLTLLEGSLCKLAYINKLMLHCYNIITIFGLNVIARIKRLTMVRLATRREQCESWNDDICPNIIKSLQVLSHESRTCRCLKVGDGEYEVLDGKSMLPVNLKDKTCAYNVWQLSRLHCKHVMRAIIHAHEDPKKYVSERYSLRRYKLTYANTIKPIPDVEQWPDNTYPEIAPPNMKSGIGRLLRNRRREEGEQAKGKRSKTVKCSKYQNYGHNSHTCQGGLIGKEKAAMAPSAGQINKKHASKSKPRGCLCPGLIQQQLLQLPSL